MFPRLVFSLLIVMVVAALGYGASRFFAVRQPLPQAISLIERGDPRGAQLVLRPVLRNDPRNAEAHVLLARTQLDLHDPVAAERELKAARALRYERTVVTPMLARAYMMQGRWQDVLADVPAVAADNDERVQNLTLRAAAYVSMNDLTQAEASIDAAAEIAPDNPRLVLVRASALAARNKVPEALAQVDAALAGLPRSTAALMLKADLTARADHPEKALETLDQAVGIEPYNVAVRLQRAQLFMALGDDAKAKADVDAALEVDWHDTQVLMTLAMLQIRAGKVGDGVTTLQRLQADFERYPLGYYYLAYAGSLANQYESAYDFLGRYNRQRPGDLNGMRLQGLLDLKLGRPGAAVPALQTVVRRAPNDAEAWDLLGRGLFMLRHKDEALEAYGKAAALDPANKDYAAHLAAARLSFGEAPAARASAGTE